MASLGTCQSGFVFYSCGNGFKGCCRVNPCGPDQCPEEQRTTASTTITNILPLTTESTVETETASSSVSATGPNPDDGTTPSSSVPQSTGTSETATKSNSPSSSPSPSPASSSTTPPTHPPSPSTAPAAPPTVYVPIPTTAPPAQPITDPNNSGGGNNDHPRLSATAIAGISVGGTVAAALLSLLAYLLIRRRCIAWRNARAPSSHPFTFASPPARDAAGFMADHPMWCEEGEKGRGSHGTTEEEGTAGGPRDIRGLSELP
ncbi:hypothetical protein F4805DRAFT_473322 [Annulohypoxylon moriforme]|nr:hypothetical protein F4805DRAFT_473322 [Annulohypoxylon moriforme]